MSYNDFLSGTILIDPPVLWAELKDAGVPIGKYTLASARDAHDVQLRIQETVNDTPDGQFTAIYADAITTTGGANGRWVVDELTAIARAFGEGHTFTGYIHRMFEPRSVPTGQPPCERYVIRGTGVVTITPALTWPGLED